MSVVAAVSAISAVQARIGQIEQQLGVRRALPLDVSTTASPAVGASVASAAAAIAIDPSASLTELLSNDPAASTGTSFDDVFELAVAELRAQWGQSVPSVTPATTAMTATPASAAIAATAAEPVVAGAVSPTTPYASLFEEAGARYDIPPKVLAAIGFVESRFRTDAVSSAGAVGMMQFLPSTAASMGVDPCDPASAIDGTARYLRSALDRFGSLGEAIASYNVGPGAIARAGGVQPGSQAERYLTHVLDATGRI